MVETATLHAMASPETDRARSLRRNMTGVEWKLWRRLRGKRLGVKFRRQHPIGPYVADFASVEAGLVVELDGDTHVKAYDIHRDLWMQTRGWRVMRIVLSEVDEDLDAAVGEIALELAQPGSMLSYGSRFLD
jgi:very-short-patch-repair endonuclease